MGEGLTTKNMMLNEIDKHPKGYKTKLAEIAGYTGKNKGSNFTRTLTNESQEFENFSGLIELFKHFWGQNYIQMMVKYSKEVYPNKSTARYLLELLYTNRQFEAFNDLLDRMDNCNYDKNKEWAKLYRLYYQYELSYTDEEFDKLIEQLDNIHLNSFELNINKKLLLSFCFAIKNEYDIAKFHLIGLEKSIEKIENDYIKEKYLIRYNQFMAYNQLYLYNDPDAARKSSDIVTSSNAEPAIKAYSYYVKGYSYLFTSFEEALNNLNKSLQLYEQLNKNHEIEDLKEKIEFVSIYWDQFEGEEPTYLNNNIFWNIKKGNDVSNKLTEGKDKIDEGLFLYFEGLNEKSNKKLKLSLIKMVKKNDKFLSNLPKIELIKNGEDQDIIDALSA